MSADYVATFGKFKGKRLGELPREEVQNYIEWVEKTAQKSGKPVSENALELKKAFASYCSSVPETKAIATKSESSPVAVDSNFGGDKLALIKKTFGSTLSDLEFQLYMSVANARGLDPLLNQIHAVKRQGKMTIQVGIDGYRLIAQRTKEYAGRDAAIFEYTEGLKHPDKATVTCYRLVGGVRCAYTATASWKEYCPEGTQAFMWNKMPETMLEKVCEAKCLRMAFPGEMSGLYVNEEMHQADQKSMTTSEYLDTIPSPEKGAVVYVKLPERSKDDEKKLREMGFVFDWQESAYVKYLDDAFDMRSFEFSYCAEVVERPAGAS